MTTVKTPPTTRTITAGAGLTGGGDLSTDRTISVDFESVAEEILVTKKATHCIGSANASFDFDSAVDWLQRTLITLPVTTTRWRLVMASKNAFTGTAVNRATSMPSAYVGAPEYASGGRWNGNCVGSMVQAISSTVSVSGDGSDATSAWVTDPSAQFAAHTPLVLSLALSIASGTDDFVVSDINTWTASGSNSYVGTADASAVLAQSGIWILDVRIEYEAEVDSSTKVALVVGASSESGYNPDTPQDPSQSWPYQMGLLTEHLVIGAGLGGTGMSAFNSTSNRGLSRLDLSTTVPDLAVVGLGSASNDINAGETLSTLKGMVAAILGALADLSIDRVYVCTVPPRSSLDGTKEGVRTSFNAWLRTLPLGVAGVLDADLLLRDPADTTAFIPELLCSDNLHPTLAGHQVLAQSFRIA